MTKPVVAESDSCRMQYSVSNRDSFAKSRALLLPFTLSAVLSCFGLACTDVTGIQHVQGLTIPVENHLLVPVSVTVNGINIGEIMPDSTLVVTRGYLAPVDVRWSTQPLVKNGREFGHTVTGQYEIDLPDDGTTVPVSITNIDPDLSGKIYAGLLVSNRSDRPMEIGLNMGTSSENRTGCLIEGGTEDLFLGYYPIDSLLNIRAYRPEIAYNPLVFLEETKGRDFTVNDLIDGSGRLHIVFESRPPSAELFKEELR